MKVTRQRVRAALKAQGVPLASSRYDGSSVTVTEFVDSWGVGTAYAVGVDTATVKAALEAEGLPFTVGNYVHVPKETTP